MKWKPGTTDLVPDLATDMGTISRDGLTYTFTLKDGIKFGDGTPLTATVYAAQLNRLLTIGPKCPNDVADSLAVPYVKSITAPDDKTIVFTLTTPIAFFPQILAGLRTWHPTRNLQSRRMQPLPDRPGLRRGRLVHLPTTTPMSRWSSSPIPTTPVI